ncbi:TetR/AcrR family transcriptional regulator [Hyphomicrobium sulfonivorans]|uniref:TetR/AcrR family transcriptional regulator n=1 Tax=Hyphomicrobium sulfonivorans TaxID=121290 RepID=UPI0015704B51|nr:TetR/AcrR family transcriptional regulator [Hyphomicrobium sulfonivorans]MBI1650863.1 TetR/AcrR family transcriptional regulator [Hyphomicrobium sulfonivorans]
MKKINTSAVTTRHPGRPLALSESDRRAAILTAAEGVFTNIGYGAATMEEIARAAAMSKKTVYSFFPDKRAIFSALISFVELYPEGALVAKNAATRADLTHHLQTIAERAQLHVEMTRLVISEARHCPELAAVFRERTIRQGKRFFTDAVRAFQTSHNQNVSKDVEDTAAMLFGAIVGDLHLRALLGERPLSRNKLQKHIDNALRLILPNG